MNILEKSKQYAEGKAINALTAAIEEAYASGYKDGFSDGQANREEPLFEAKYAVLNYIDLELPSGTKWATGYLKLTNGSIPLLNYSDASIFNLPTKEQYQELLNSTDQFYVNKTNSSGTEFVSKINKGRLYIPSAFYNEGEDTNIIRDNYVFWLKDTPTNPLTRFGVYGAAIRETRWDHKLPVILVSK